MEHHYGVHLNDDSAHEQAKGKLALCEKLDSKGLKPSDFKFRLMRAYDVFRKKVIVRMDCYSKEVEIA